MRMRSTLLSTSLLVAALALSGCKSNEQKAQDHLQSAQKFVQSGDLARAGVEFRNAIQLDPKSRAARVAFAKMLESQGNLSGAYAQYAGLIERHPDDIGAIDRAAVLAADLGDWSAAGQQVKAGLAVKADDITLKAVQAGVEYSTALSNRDDEARKAAAAKAQALSAKLPDNLMLYRILVDNDMRNRTYDAALKQVDAGLKVAPKNRQLLTMRLGVLSAQKDQPAIEAQLKAMVKLFPGDQQVQATLVRWYVTQKKLDDAEAYLRQLAAEAKPDDVAKADMTLVTFLTQYRGPDKALAELDKILASGNVPKTPTQAEADDKSAGKTEDGTAVTLESFKAYKASIEFQQGKRDQAMQDMEAILKDAPATDETRRLQVILAKMKYASGDKVAARQLVEKVLAADKGQVQALLLKAGWLIDDDNTDDAIALLRAALENQSNNVDAMTLMAQAYTRAGKPDLAGDMLNQAYEASNRAPAEALRYAQLLVQQNKDTTAETVLIQSLRLDPANLTLLVPLGQLYVKMKDWPRASGVIQRLDQIGTPEAVKASQALKPAVLAGQKNLGAATEYLQGLVKDGQGGINAQVAVIRGLLAQGKVPEAKQAADQLLAEKPDDPARRFIAASVGAATGDVAGAETSYRALLKQNPKLGQIWLALVQLMYADNQPDKAQQALSEALKELPDAAPLLLIQAANEERAGKIDGAIAIYQKLYDQDSNSPVNANNLASLLSSYHAGDQKDLDRAYTISRRLVGTTVPPFADTYGWILYLRGQPDQAVSYLETAAKGLSKNAMVQYHLAEAYQKLNETDKARAQFQKVVALVKPDDKRPFVEAARKALAAKPADTAASDTSGAAAGAPKDQTGN